jgi:hypothetical protein
MGHDQRDCDLALDRLSVLAPIVLGKTEKGPIGDGDGDIGRDCNLPDLTVDRSARR